MIALLALVAAVAVEPIKPGPWITNADYPAKAKNAREHGAVAFRVTVTPDGKPASCEITQSSGIPVLEAQTCALMMARSRFLPARDGEGQPAFGVFASRAMWVLPDSAASPVSAPIPPDLSISVQALPKSLPKHPKLTVIIAMDASGSITACEAKADKAATILGPTACAQVRSLAHPRAAIDGSGKPVSSIQSLTVAFDVGP